MFRVSIRACVYATAFVFIIGATAEAANERTIGTIVGAGVGGAVGGIKGAVVGGAAGNLVGAVVKNERSKSKAAAAPDPGPPAEAQESAPANDTPEISDGDVIAEAAPLLHHTCRSLVEGREDDQDAINADIRKLVALSVANRDIDLSDPPMTEETREEIRAEFADELGDRCARDVDAVLVGVVDAVIADLARVYR